MKFNSGLIKMVHKITKEIKAEFNDIDYKTQFGICLSYLLSEKDEDGLVELEGSEKQIKWAKDIRRRALKDCKIAWIFEVQGEKEWERRKDNVNRMVVDSLLYIKIAEHILTTITSAHEIIENCRAEAKSIGLYYEGSRKYNIKKINHEKIKALKDQKTFDFNTLDEYFI